MWLCLCWCCAMCLIVIVMVFVALRLLLFLLLFYARARLTPRPLCANKYDTRRKIADSNVAWWHRRAARFNVLFNDSS